MGALRTSVICWRGFESQCNLLLPLVMSSPSGFKKTLGFSSLSYYLLYKWNEFLPWNKSTTFSTERSTIFFFRINLFQQFLFMMIYPGVTFAFRTWLVSWIIQLSLIPWIFFSFASPLSLFSKKMTTWASLRQSISPFLSCKGCTTIFFSWQCQLELV